MTDILKSMRNRGDFRGRKRICSHSLNLKKYVERIINMWIAKNSKTNETYGKKYNSIYDCQKYIDKELFILEYLYRRCEVITKSIKNEEAFKKYMSKKYPNGYSIVQQMCECLNFAVQPFQKQIKKILQGKQIKKIANDEYHSNNIIRCYYVEQHRFANSFDF